MRAPRTRAGRADASAWCRPWGPCTRVICRCCAPVGRAPILLILTIFVNPTQFAANEDLSAYPRDERGDLAKARACGVDVAFCPEVAAMYPPGHQTHVEVAGLQAPLCGRSRPGHFRGVTTVVSKLFNTTRPDLAIFGQKDYQQLAVIRRMVRDLDFGIDIVGMPIVREHDGLAMSSRNAYLDADERVQAVSLARGLAAARRRFLAGERHATEVTEPVRATVEAAGARVEYIELCDAESLAPVAYIEAPAVLALAVFVGRIRLIDNALLTP